eukprot:scaffold19626_cov66-Phaeocystis_antarctica.AAC.3
MVRMAAAHRKRGPRGQSFVQHVSCNTERYQVVFLQFVIYFVSLHPATLRSTVFVVPFAQRRRAQRPARPTPRKEPHAHPRPGQLYSPP